MILVELIRNPDSSFEQLAGAISRCKGVTVKAAQIEKLFDLHALKETGPTAQPEP